MTLQLCLDLALVALLCLASAFDLAQRRIPNFLVAVGLITAAVLHASSGSAWSLLTVWLGGMALGLALFLPLYCLRTMAAGDVKLMMMVGAFCGPALTWHISLATYCAGGLLAVLIVLARGKGRAAARNVAALLRPMLWRIGGVRLAPEAPPASVGSMPYALAISAGTFIVLWLRHT